jgi:hypothetical protein
MDVDRGIRHASIGRRARLTISCPIESPSLPVSRTGRVRDEVDRAIVDAVRDFAQR